MAEANSAESTSRPVKTDSSAGELSSTFVDCTTSAACTRLWYGASFR